MATATEEKSKGGRPANEPKLDPQAIIDATLRPKANGAKLAKITGIGRDVSRHIMRVTEMTVEQFQEAQKAKLQAAMDLALQQTQDTMHKASALQAATVYGILGDKLARPGPTNQTLHIHLAAGDRSGAIAALLGKHGERVSGERDSVSTRPGSVSTGKPSPTIDAEATPILHTGDSQSPAKPRK